ncbi:hypothetical protein GCM10027076_21660 [Nocardioides montaniterrae]
MLGELELLAAVSGQGKVSNLVVHVRFLRGRKRCQYGASALLRDLPRMTFPTLKGARAADTIRTALHPGPSSGRLS